VITAEEEDWEGWDLHFPELSWELWSTLEAIDWKYPPDVVLRQPERIMDDLRTISWRRKLVEDWVQPGPAGVAATRR